MKRTLDEIELTEIESFCINGNTLVIETKTEKNVYQYPNQLELLRRIHYFMHRYELEYNRKKELDKNPVSILTPAQKKHQKRSKLISDVAFKFNFACIVFMMMFPMLFFLLIELNIIANATLLAIARKSDSIVKCEFLQQKEMEQNCINQMNKGFESLKQVAISYLDRILENDVSTDSNICSTNNKNFIREEQQDIIAEIKKGFQKRIGTYPNSF